MVLGYEKFTIITLSNAGRGGSKKSKPIPTPPPSAGLKSCPIPTSPPLQGGKNPCGAKRGGAGLAGQGKITILKYSWRFLMDICD